MAERQPPPSSSSSSAAGLSRKERPGLVLIDADPVWAPVQEQEPAWPGDENYLVDYSSGRVVAASAEEQDKWVGASARRAHRDASGRGFSPPRQRQRRQDTPSSRRTGSEQDCWSPRKFGRHSSGESQDISLSRRRVRHDSYETEDTWRPRRRSRHALQERDDEMVTFTTQDHSLAMKGPKAGFGDQKGAYLKLIFGSRSKREGKVWHCACKATNSPIPKLVFGLPKFCCACGRKFLETNDLNFCLADVRVNWDLVVSRVFDQDGPSCMENAICQAMLISHTMDCLTKDTKVKKSMLQIDPGELTTTYLNEYQWNGQGSMSSTEPSSIHKFIKMALMLKKRGIELTDGSFWRIGDISFIAKDDHEAICEELANGVPLLAVITPGVNFQKLKYCEVYRPPLLEDLHECNNFHETNNHQYVHEAHMVVLVGPAFKAQGKNRGRAYYFVNSHKYWCERKVIDTTHELAEGIKKPVDYGIGKVEEGGLVYNVIKLWKFGETAGQDSILLEDEDEDETNKYHNKPSNRQKFTGEYQARPKSMKKA